MNHSREVRFFEMVNLSSRRGYRQRYPTLMVIFELRKSLEQFARHHELAAAAICFVTWFVAPTAIFILSWFAETYPRQHYEFFINERIEAIGMLPFIASSLLGFAGSLWVARDEFNLRSALRRTLLWLPFLLVSIASIGFVVHYVFKT